MSVGEATIADLVGPWVEPNWESGLVERCKVAWNKPLVELTRAELATLLRQRIAVEHLLPFARKSLEQHQDDDTEMYEGELEDAIERAKP